MFAQVTLQYWENLVKKQLKTPEIEFFNKIILINDFYFSNQLFKVCPRKPILVCI